MLTKNHAARKKKKKKKLIEKKEEIHCHSSNVQFVYDLCHNFQLLHDLMHAEIVNSLIFNFVGVGCILVALLFYFYYLLLL